MKRRKKRNSNFWNGVVTLAQGDSEVLGKVVSIRYGFATRSSVSEGVSEHSCSLRDEEGHARQIRQAVVRDNISPR